ncbi:gamma-glutamyltransferase 2. Threonine peptidase. MEROPS family T03 [Roseivivax lentus]|uniref:Gamma-glutamyltransferase 2. Threonine peptidase. MEROPS family T03 n=1 Tax=Roseivivax lentus TaxID=633194 RepID=A0A1N7K2B9_9RHOB|nr:gamma-glutamyltransferase family protein [Roseivivax lentus]SIS55742.1 gamma-glutamyltransferase 2. Threonine peptidase. MEROPS family T03 [Roseivivax lentus]
MRDFHLPGRSSVHASNGMVATSHPLASAVAIDILKFGGNAVDAAIAGGVLLGLCEPQMTGIGGDCFALISRPGEDVVAVNGSGRAPAGARAATLRAAGHETVPEHSAHAVTIPGAIDAFARMSERWGKLGLADSLAPSIRYMEEGVPVAPRVAFDWAAQAGTLQGAARDHYLKDGAPYRTGDVFALPGQAEVLRRIARDGPQAFYDGEVAEDMLRTLSAAGGAHKAEDFAEVAATLGAPIEGHYKGRDLLEHPPNGQSATAILLLNILKRFDLAAMDPWGTERAHIEAEATKLAYDARNRFLSDPDYMTRLDHMLSDATAEALAALIDPKRAQRAVTEITEAVHKDTIYITVVDRDRMAVSLIYSIFHGFGSGLASEKFGILLQNRGAGFSLAEGHPNEMAPGKRPMHTIIPAMLREGGRVTMPFGVMGGQYQSAGHARFLTNIADFGLDPQAAIDGPRCFAEGTQLSVERGYAPEVRQALAEMGHDVVVPDGPIGGAQAIVIHENGTLEGASDARKDGAALGY